MVEEELESSTRIPFANPEIKFPKPPLPEGSVNLPESPSRELSVRRTIASRENLVMHAIEHSSHLLPVQGPIGVFIHHNTLHAFQDWTFEEAVDIAGTIFGAEPYWTEDLYKDAVARGRISESDVEAIIESESRDWSNFRKSDLSFKEIYRAVLLHGASECDEKSIHWQVEENRLLRHLPPSIPNVTRERIKQKTVEIVQELLRLNKITDLCEYLTGQNDLQIANRMLRRRTGLRFNTRSITLACQSQPESLAACALWSRCEIEERKTKYNPKNLTKDLRSAPHLDEVNYWMSRFCSVFLDQGVARAPLPDRDRGFYAAFRSMVLKGLLPARWFRPAHQVLNEHSDPMAAILWALRQREITDLEIDSTIEMELFALPGWAGLIYRFESDPGLAPRYEVRCSLVDYLAVRLVCGVFSRQEESPNVGKNPEALKSRVWDLFSTACALGWVPIPAQTGSFSSLLQVLDEFTLTERRRYWHLAYERHHEQEVLSALHEITPHLDHASPEVQIITCIDEREESLRRHLEEQGDEIETLGAAGFFGVAMNYKGMDDVHPAPYCPVVVKPQHVVAEQSVPGLEFLQILRQKRRRLWGACVTWASTHSRGMLLGPVLSLLGGTIALLLTVARVLTPGRVAQSKNWFSQLWIPTPKTSLTLLKSETQTESQQPLLGFTIDEKVERVGKFLRDIGLSNRMAPLVVFLGHGSTSLNNPHESAHDCGACGGRRGGANARAFAAMANHSEVRTRLAAKGLMIPSHIWFVGGYHDTSSDEVTLFDEGLVPESHRARLSKTWKILERARTLSAHERTRRFHIQFSEGSEEAALRHVESRAASWAEPRPEYGHCTNAVAIVGRRKRTRGLFLDRRAFLVSYDPTFDSDSSQLTGILGAVGPVCAGINLEYYFSSVDNERYGCGTKLPHNVTGLVGVVNGHSGDLRTGLPWQMVELHEPVRLLLIVECSQASFMQVMEKNAEVRELVKNRWIRVALLNPQGSDLLVYDRGVFRPFASPNMVLPRVENSVSWYQGRKDFLPPAFIMNARLKKEVESKILWH